MAGPISGSSPSPSPNFHPSSSQQDPINTRQRREVEALLIDKSTALLTETDKKTLKLTASFLEGAARQATSSRKTPSSKKLYTDLKEHIDYGGSTGIVKLVKQLWRIFCGAPEPIKDTDLKNTLKVFNQMNNSPLSPSTGYSQQACSLLQNIRDNGLGEQLTIILAMLVPEESAIAVSTAPSIPTLPQEPAASAAPVSDLLKNSSSDEFAVLHKKPRQRLTKKDDTTARGDTTARDDKQQPQKRATTASTPSSPTATSSTPSSPRSASPSASAIPPASIRAEPQVVDEPAVALPPPPEFVEEPEALPPPPGFAEADAAPPIPFPASNSDFVPSAPAPRFDEPVASAPTPASAESLPPAAPVSFSSISDVQTQLNHHEENLAKLKNAIDELAVEERVLDKFRNVQINNKKAFSEMANLTPGHLTADNIYAIESLSKRSKYSFEQIKIAFGKIKTLESRIRELKAAATTSQQALSGSLSSLDPGQVLGDDDQPLLHIANRLQRQSITIPELNLTAKATKMVMDAESLNTQCQSLLPDSESSVPAEPLISPTPTPSPASAEPIASPELTRPSAASSTLPIDPSSQEYRDGIRASLDMLSNTMLTTEPMIETAARDSSKPFEDRMIETAARDSSKPFEDRMIETAARDSSKPFERRGFLMNNSIDAKINTVKATLAEIKQKLESSPRTLLTTEATKKELADLSAQQGELEQLVPLLTTFNTLQTTKNDPNNIFLWEISTQTFVVNTASNLQDQLDQGFIKFFKMPPGEQGIYISTAENNGFEEFYKTLIKDPNDPPSIRDAKLSIQALIASFKRDLLSPPPPRDRYQPGLPRF